MSEPTSPLQIPDYRRFWTARFLLVCATLSMVVLIGYQTYGIARSDYGMSEAQAAGGNRLLVRRPEFLAAPKPASEKDLTPLDDDED